jgi:hypothetical protein
VGTRVALEPPEVGAGRVRFRWRVEPPAAVYRRSEFELRLPDALEASRLPDALWWRLGILCLHPTWLFLGPCRVRIPVGLAPGEAEFWRRLLEAEKCSLEGHRAQPDWALPVELDAGGPPLTPLPSLPAGERCASAFSGGKDSLLQAALLAELTPRPLLVAVTSHGRGLDDHRAARRRWLLGEVERRRDVELVEVESDFRDVARNRHSRELGLPAGVNELVDTFLYLAGLVAVGFARGVARLHLASEAEVQQNLERDGRVVQHPHGVYSTATLAALSALLAPAGVRVSSLTAPLHAWQVQRLLWTRHPDLAELQFSCWRVGPDQAWCNGCALCLRAAYGILAAGGRPSRVGLDLARLLPRMRDWQPPPPPAPPGLPSDAVRWRLNQHAARMMADTPPAEVLRDLPAWRRATPAGGRARSAARALCERARALAPAPLPGWRPGFASQLDPRLRPRLDSLYAASFAAEPEDAYAPVLERSERLAAWLAAPLARAAREDACPIPA